jgi:hypothetical protein
MSDEFRRNLKEVRFSCHSDMKENIFAEISRSGVCRVLVGADASGAEACLVAAFALYKQTGSSKKTWKRIVRTDHNPSNSAEAKDEEVRETFVLPPAEVSAKNHGLKSNLFFCTQKKKKV